MVLQAFSAIRSRKELSKRSNNSAEVERLVKSLIGDLNYVGALVIYRLPKLPNSFASSRMAACVAR